MKPLSMVVAAAAGNRAIGRQGALPWHEPEDLQHFKTVTTGHAIIMGRKTWDALGRPLPRRRNLVVTRQSGFSATGAEVFATLEAALAAAYTTDPAPCIIGGGELYRLALPLATRIEYTEIARTVTDADAFFPELGPEWTITSQRDSGVLSFRVLERA
jgi:dihydrofolate reductase